MASASIVKTGFGVDVSDFKQFAKALRLAAPKAKAQLALELRAMGDVVAEDAQSLLEPYSQSIPGGIKVRVSGVSVSVVATVMPLSGLFELGSKGRENADNFSHPVFGNKSVWVTQPKHEFLGPAVKDHEAEIEEAATKALDAAIHTAATE